MPMHTVLGLDASTQSLTAVIVDRATGQVLMDHSVAYPASVWIPADHPGQADQSAPVFVAALDKMLQELKSKGAPLGTVDRIGVSAQQHGCVFLSPRAPGLLGTLNGGNCVDRPLAERLAGLFSSDRAPMWMTSDTGAEAEELMRAAGGKAAMIELTGSASPLRFTGALIRKFGKDHPRIYQETERIALLSQFFPMLLTGSVDVPVDWGNGSGTSLMDYHARIWSPVLLAACALGLPGGRAALEEKLGALAHPLTVAGTLASWYVKRYGFSPECEVLIGSGDNPQTKVLADGDLLSLGSSFVLMAESADAKGLLDPRGWGNAMVDGLGRPFLFGCRTNGALVWDGLRRQHAADFSQAEDALGCHGVGSVLAVHQPLAESFPPSPALAAETQPQPFDAQWAGAVDSTLGLLFLGCRPWLTGKNKPLLVTGGPTASPGIVRRVAAFAARPTQVIGTTGAALGAAAAAHSLDGTPPDWLPASTLVTATSAEIDAVHASGGYLDRLKHHWQTITGIDPTGANA